MADQLSAEAPEPGPITEYKPDYTYPKIELLRLANGDLAKAQEYWQWVKPG